MVRLRFIPVWLGIILLSGLFLIGQESWPPTEECIDLDADGYGDPASSSCTYAELDCDDSNADVYPGAPELCDGIDNQCPGDSCYSEIDAHCGSPSPGMAYIPCGCFSMGDAFASLTEGDPDEQPAHNVCISAFEMDLHEVTNAQYAACVAGGGCTPPHDSSSYSRWTYYSDPAYDGFPVIHVDWYQATDFCEWAGKRLSKEAEWEYAARGGLAGKRYPWGDEISGSNANSWNSGDPWDNDTSSVGYYAANGYGLYDVTGNVLEWVDDWYQENYYAVSPSNDPPGPVSGTSRVLRGGDWGHWWADILLSNLRVADRSYDYPDSENDYVGFRCARDGAYGP